MVVALPVPVALLLGRVRVLLMVLGLELPGATGEVLLEDGGVRVEMGVEEREVRGT